MPQPRINLPHFRPVTAGLAVTNAKLCIQWSQTRAACSLYSARDAHCWVFDSCGTAEKTSPLVIGKGTEFLHQAPGDGCPDLGPTAGAMESSSLSLTKYAFPSPLTTSPTHLSFLLSWTQFSLSYSRRPPLLVGPSGLSPCFPQRVSFIQFHLRRAGGRD